MQQTKQPILKSFENNEKKGNKFLSNQFSFSSIGADYFFPERMTPRMMAREPATESRVIRSPRTIIEVTSVKKGLR